MATVSSPEYRLSEAQWGKIKGLLPANGRRGGQWKDHRRMIDGILWVLSDGGRWRNLPERFGPWQSVYDRFRRWTRRGLWGRLLDHLRVRKEINGEIDWGLFVIDGSIVRAHQSAAGASQKRGRSSSPLTTRLGGARAATALSCT